MKLRKKGIGLFLYTIFIVLISSFVTMWINGNLSFSDDKQKMLAKASGVYNLIKDEFLFEYDNKKISDFMIEGMVSSLDDIYSTYFKNEDYKNKVLDMKGHTYGIGVSVLQESEETGYINIVQIHENTPAEKAGLQVGDIITKIDDTDLKDKKYLESVEMIKGQEGTSVNLTVLRNGVLHSFTVERKDVELTYVTTKIIEDIGYVKIVEFTDSTSKQFIDKVTQLQSQGVKGLVFDVRNNGGGTLTSVLEMLDFLLPEGELAKVTDKNGKERVYKYSDDKFVDLPMLVLSNGESASASELFIQTLKDFEKAKSVGEKSFGKGILQTNFELDDGSAVKLTTGYFSGPKSDNFHGKGINADYEVKMSQEDNIKLLVNQLKPEDDVQLQKALEIIKQGDK